MQTHTKLPTPLAHMINFNFSALIDRKNTKFLSEVYIKNRKKQTKTNKKQRTKIRKTKNNNKSSRAAAAAAAAAAELHSIWRCTTEIFFFFCVFVCLSEKI